MVNKLLQNHVPYSEIVRPEHPPHSHPDPDEHKVPPPEVAVSEFLG